MGDSAGKSKLGINSFFSKFYYTEKPNAFNGKALCIIELQLTATTRDLYFPALRGFNVPGKTFYANSDEFTASDEGQRFHVIYRIFAGVYGAAVAKPLFQNIIEVKVWDSAYDLAPRVAGKRVVKLPLPDAEGIEGFLLIGDAVRDPYVQFAHGVNDAYYMVDQMIAAFESEYVKVAKIEPAAKIEAVLTKYDSNIAEHEIKVIKGIHDSIFGGVYAAGKLGVDNAKVGCYVSSAKNDNEYTFTMTSTAIPIVVILEETEVHLEKSPDAVAGALHPL